MTNQGSNSNLNILITLLTLFAGIWYFTILLILELQSQRLTSYNYDYDWKLNTLIGSSYLTFIYILYILYAMFFNSATYAINYFKKESLLKKKEELFKSVILSWPALLLLILFLFLYFITYYGSNKNIAYFIIMIIGYGIPIYQFMKKYVKKQYLKIDYKKTIEYVIVLSILFNVIVFISYYVLLVAITTDVKVTYEKNVYLSNEKVRFEARPTGIILPKITNITYSNKNIQVFDGTNEEFKSVPRYLTIEPKLLTSEPENSFIIVRYHYFDTNIKGFRWLNTFNNIIISNVPIYER